MGEVGNSQIVEGLVGHAKESGFFYFKCSG